MGVFPKLVNGDFLFEQEKKLFGMEIVTDNSIPKSEIHIKQSNKTLAILEDEASKEEDE